MAKKATLVSLAKTLGVSRQTVSNALNNPQAVAPDTLQRVLQAVEKSGYRPDRAARQLRTHASHTIAMRIMPSMDGISGHILNQFIHQVALTAGERGYRIVILAAHDKTSELEQYLDLASDGEIDGVILSDTTENDPRPARLMSAGIPFSSFGRPWGEFSDGQFAPFSWVDIDCRLGTRKATEELIHCGHKRIGYLSWPISPGIGYERFSGWQEAVLSSGMNPQLMIEIPTDSTTEAVLAAEKLIEQHVTAIVCASDSLALGAARAAEGKMIDVIGFDDTPVARALNMSSVAQPIEEAAVAAFNMLIERISNKAAKRHTLLQPKVQLRHMLSAEQKEKE